MRRTVAITIVLLVLAQALAAAVPMLHQPEVKPAHHPGRHDCCPQPAVQVRDCCPRTVSCPHQHHSAASCCCAESGETGFPSRKELGNKPAIHPATVMLTHVGIDGRDRITPADTGPPLDNSPPILVLRN